MNENTRSFRLDKKIHKKIKLEAVKREMTIKEFIENAVEKELNKNKRS